MFLLSLSVLHNFNTFVFEFLCAIGNNVPSLFSSVFCVVFI